MAWQTPKTNWQENNALTPTDFNRIEGNIQELQNTKETPAGAQAKVNTHAGSKQTHGISSGYYIAKTSRSDQLPAWNDIQGKPSLVTSSDLSNGLAAKVDKPTSATSGNIAVFDGGAGKIKDAGKKPTDFMSNVKVYGYAQYSDEIPPQTTLTKTIALGGTYKHGIVVFDPGSSSHTGIMVFIGTDPAKALVVGGTHRSASERDASAWSRRKRGWITHGTANPSYTPTYGPATGSSHIGINDVYISGTNLIIVFYNAYADAPRSLNCDVDWEVW
jgi:hypothetical protein